MTAEQSLEAIKILGLNDISAKHPGVTDVYVLEVCKLLGTTPDDVTQEQRREAKAHIEGRLLGMAPEKLAAIEKMMREGQF